MKILIMGFSKIKYMPYMHFYLEELDPRKHEVHILYWNRDLMPEDLEPYAPYTLHEFSCYQEDDVPKTSKITSFLKYRRFAKKLIRKEKFDRIFVLHTLPGVLVGDMLKRYRGRYILDYRDSTYEGIGLFKALVGRMVADSAATFVSSDGFRRFLPAEHSEKTYTSHNLLTDSLSHREEKEKYGITSDKIRLSFWGFIRHEAVNRQIIEKIAADPRFQLHYYGREQQVAQALKAYALELGAENVFFHGEYTPDQRYDFVRNTDIIHNLYLDPNTQLAMGNKYYDGIIFRLPQLCMETSFMAKCVEEAGIGLACDPADPEFTDKIYDYYRTLDRERFAKNCDAELQRVLEEVARGKAVVLESVS